MLACRLVLHLLKVTFVVTEPFARDCLERARRFVERVERYLKEAGHL